MIYHTYGIYHTSVTTLKPLTGNHFQTSVTDVTDNRMKINVGEGGCEVLALSF